MTGIAVSLSPSADEAARIERALQFVRERTGTDFSHYRPDTLRRRILNRMISVSASSLEQYLERLADSEHEAQALVARLTIKVSRFYRNAVTFDLLRGFVIPELVRAHPSRPLHIWSAGCGCGEEAWTLAMLLDEAGAAGTVVATDLDPSALSSAEAALYPRRAIEELPADLAARYLEAADGGYRVRDTLHGRVRFACQDLTQEGPCADSSVDLACCRNVLIYWRREAQERAVRRLRKATATGGFLCFGEAEWPAPAVAHGLEPLAHKARVFRQIRPLDRKETNEN